MVRKCSEKLTQFKFFAPSAKRVSLAGNFNNWDISSLAAKKDSKGNWVAKVNLRPGRYEYKFYVDGGWAEDPNCNARTTSPLGSQNCLIEVK